MQIAYGIKVVAAHLKRAGQTAGLGMAFCRTGEKAGLLVGILLFFVLSRSKILFSHFDFK
jgi:hypothetical protein